MPGCKRHLRREQLHIQPFSAAIPKIFALGDENASVLQQRNWQPFFVCLAVKLMQMNALTLSASRRRKNVVILSAVNISASLSTSRSERLSHALSQVWQWVQCKCAPGRIVRALFSAKVSTVVAFVCVAAMWWHNISIDSVLEAQEAVAFDCLCAMPWGIVWTIRATVASFKEKGGAA